MRNLFASVALCSVALFGSAALACEEHAKLEQESMQEERVMHYEVEAPKTEAAAMALLQSKANEVSELLAKNAKLDDNQMESIHEKSYSLEAAINKLREATAEKSKEAALDGVDEAVQELHYASESHKEEQVRQSFASLEAHLIQLKTIASAH